MTSVRWMTAILAVPHMLGCGASIDDPDSYGAGRGGDRQSDYLDSQAEREPVGPGPSSPNAAPSDEPNADGPEPSNGWDMRPPAEPSWDDSQEGHNEPAYMCNFRELVQAKCGNQSCHGAPALDSGLDLTSDGLPARLESRTGPGSCADLPMVDHDVPERSALYLKVTGDSCGRQMPPGGSLSDDEQACFLSWIDGLPDPGPADPAPTVDVDMMVDEQVTPADDVPACDFSALVQMRCGNPSCHGAPASTTGLDLTSPSLGTRLEGREGPASCGGVPMIDRSNPAASALYLKVAGTDCGTQMPPGGSLSPAEQSCFLSWIEGL